jgi:8-oxo-dGTP pyrophosphatase MutT (NUDIX family)
VTEAVPRGSTFQVVGATPVADVGFLALSETLVRGPGNESFTRFVVHHPGAVVVVPVVSDRTAVLMVRQFRAAAGRDLLEVPAGKRDVDGEAPEATAARELAEEIGHEPGRLVKLCEFYNSPGFCDEYTHLFAAFDLVELDDRAAVSAEEAAMTIERIELDDVEGLVAAREIVDAKSIIGLMLARRLVAGEYAGIGY